MGNSTRYVLVVEDITAAANAVRDALINSGITAVIVANTYDEAMQAIADKDPDVLVVDHLLPKSSLNDDGRPWGHKLAHLAERAGRLVFHYTGEPGGACDQLWCCPKSPDLCASVVQCWLESGNVYHLTCGGTPHDQIPDPETDTAGAEIHAFRHEVITPFVAADFNAQALMELLAMEESERPPNALEETASALRASAKDGSENAKKAWSGLLDVGMALPDGGPQKKAYKLLSDQGLPHQEDWALLCEVIAALGDLDRDKAHWEAMDLEQARHIVDGFRNQLAELGQKLDEVVRYLDEKCGAHRTPS